MFWCLRCQSFGMSHFSYLIQKFWFIFCFWNLTWCLKHRVSGTLTPVEYEIWSWKDFKRGQISGSGWRYAHGEASGWFSWKKVLTKLQGRFRKRKRKYFEKWFLSAYSTGLEEKRKGKKYILLKLYIILV